MERAAEARENDHEAKIKQKQKDRSRSMEDLASFCVTERKGFFFRGIYEYKRQHLNDVECIHRLYHRP